MADELDRWAARRAPELLARAEAEAVAQLRDALLRAAVRPAAAPPAPAAAPEAPPAAPRRREDGHALWAYCVTRAGVTLDDAPAGVDGAAPVQPIVCGDLAVHVSRVGLAEFGAEPLRENLNDFAWLERVARAHETVLEHALRRATIVPLRLCTIYADEDRVREMAATRAGELGAALAALEGREEWSVKLLVDPDVLRTAVAGERAGEGSGDGDTGAGYLLRRRAEREDRAAAERLAAGLADDVHARLSAWADDAVLCAPQNRELSGHRGDMLLNGAYLVERGRVQGLCDLAAELGEQHRDLGASVAVDGPFPPYNFTTAGPA